MIDIRQALLVLAILPQDIKNVSSPRILKIFFTIFKMIYYYVIKNNEYK